MGFNGVKAVSERESLLRDRHVSGHRIVRGAALELFQIDGESTQLV